MATIKVKLRPSIVEGKPGSIFYSISHKGITKQITTKVHVNPSDWDSENQTLKTMEGEEGLLQNKIDSDIANLKKIIRELDSHSGSYAVEDIIRQFKNPERYVSVIDFFEDQISFLKDCKRIGTARNYRMVFNSLLSFLDGRELFFTEITPGFIERYSDHLKIKGMVRNSLSFYMRIFRAVFNKAVRLGIVEQSFPFRETYTGIDTTRKRAVNENIVNRLIRLDLKGKKSLAFTRDMFLFSFFTRGMSYVDIAYLKKDNIKDGVIRYSRHKTGNYLSVKIEPCMQEIIDRYKENTAGLPYLFPILKNVETEKSYEEYRSALRSYNGRLKKISVLLELTPALSSYTARHTWATTARNHNIPLSVISAGMGHSSEKTTQIYLNSIENPLIDEANRELIRSLK